MPLSWIVSVGLGRSGQTPENSPELVPLDEDELLELEDELDEDELLDEELELDEELVDELLELLDDEPLDEEPLSPPHAINPDINNTSNDTLNCFIGTPIKFE